MVTLQIWDETQSQVLYDLNDSTGANSGLYGSVTTRLGSDVDLGAPTLQASTVTPQDLDATYSAFSKRAAASMKFKVVLTGTSYDNLTLACGVLAQYLTQGCVMKYATGTNTYFIDVLPSLTPALLDGKELALYRAGALFQTEIDLNLSRQPYLRGAALTAATNYLANATFLRDSNQDGTPDNWTSTDPPSTVFTIPAASQSLHVVASGASGIYQNTGTATASVGQVWTVAADVKVTSGSMKTRLWWKTSADGSISTSDSAAISSATWTRVSVSGTAPASTDHVAALFTATAGATFDLRNAQIELASSASPFRVKSQTVNLDPATSGFSKIIPVYNPATAPSPMTITAAFPDASTSVQAMDYYLATSDSVPGNKYLSDFLNGPYYAQAEANGNGWTLTAGTNTTLAGTAAATASPGSGTSAATITHATGPGTWAKRITFTRSTLLDSLRGTHRVFARVKPAAITYKHRLRMSWSAGSSTTETNDEFLLDQTTDSAASWVLCDLGTIELPRSTSVTLNAVTFDLYSRMVGNTAQDLYVDYLMLVPQDNAAHVELSGAGAGVAVTAPGAELTIPTSVGADPSPWLVGSTGGGYHMKLNANKEAAGVGSTTTYAFTGSTGGQHAITFSVRRSAFVGTLRCEVANITDNTVVSGTANTYTSSVATNTAIDLTIIMSDTNNKVYQPRVVLPDSTYTSGAVDVVSITYWAINSLGQNQQIRTDPGSTGLDRYAAERLDSSSYYVGSLDATRVPFWIPPGLSLLWVESYDVSVGGYELPHLNARTLTITPTVFPRYWA